MHAYEIYTDEFSQVVCAETIMAAYMKFKLEHNQEPFMIIQLDHPFYVYSQTLRSFPIGLS